ncbi:AbrB family transcriptional regulator [Natranaerofaba carboxydovora]|uniref:AbrB family transcriptional regulator n=1 Tax=Natranaerofaba carboxydovora TaxID=2742683 RepID=UPI001F12BD96|nr:AbrB family transcriptional regulator [Natranaerofaba carboxydovora]UMZ74280.1 Transition state regulatory protein AbrB [Natranaerofaba carboxydovora]
MWFFEELVDIGLLYALGLLGWFIGEKLRLPAAPVLGGIVLIGGMRVFGIDLPYLPSYIIIALQVILGVMVGAKLDRDALSNLKSIAGPAAIISGWALTIALLFGFVITLISPVDLTTGILGSSIGGLPEMTILAHDTEADSVTVVLFHVLRMFSTIIIFPLIFKFYSVNNKVKEPDSYYVSNDNDNNDNNNDDNASKETTKNKFNEKVGKNKILGFLWIILTLVLAGVFGGLLIYIGVPAGGLVGGLLFVVIALYFRMPIKPPPDKALSWFLVGIGLMVANQVEPETLKLIFSGELIWALVFSLFFTMLSSFAVAYGIFRLTGWDFILCFLASAPAGFTVMTGLALKEGYEPVKVSLLHLSRLVTLKLAIPILFMLFY